MKKYCLILKRLILAGIIVFVAANLFCLFYYNLPARTVNKSGTTDYKWNAGAYFCRATEGLGYGHINDDGFNNVQNLKDLEKIDILLMGSSHLEGFNVPQKAIISEVMNQHSELVSYNIGISGHNLMTCFDNLDAALAVYKPQKYLIFETMTVSFYSGQINDFLQGTRQKESAFDSTLVNLAQRIPVLRLLSTQLNNLNKNEAAAGGSADPISDEALLNEALSNVKASCEQYGVQPIIFYHPLLTVTDAGIIENTNAEDKALFARLCAKNGILFVDMTATFIEHYELTRELPHGFMNTSIGSGHLNKTGHRLIAEELLAVIEREEATK